MGDAGLVRDDKDVEAAVVEQTNGSDCVRDPMELLNPMDIGGVFVDRSVLDLGRQPVEFAKPGLRSGQD